MPRKKVPPFKKGRVGGILKIHPNPPLLKEGETASKIMKSILARIPFIKSVATRLFILFLFVGLNWTGLAAIGETFGYFNDTENSAQNIFAASTLGFSLSGGDFSPFVSPAQNATSTILLQNDGLLDFNYGARAENASGTLCSFLELESNPGSAYQPLIGFFTATTTFSASSTVIFDAQLTSNSKSLQNQMCEFKFVFDGEQLEGAGFSDTEEINQTIVSGEWPSVVINKVYYDVASDKGNEGDTSNPDEWIELYNPTNEDINVKNWTIIDNHATSTINANITIPALSFAVVSKNAGTWAPGTGYWNLPDGVIKIILGEKIGNGLANTADMLILKDSGGNIVDQMNWGTPSPSWDNYNSNLWEPGVPDAPEGHILARVPTGLDTDTPSDWHDLGLPQVAVIYPPSEVWHCGATYNIQWTATNPNGSDNDLIIDVVYIKDSNNNGIIDEADQTYLVADNISNTGSYNFTIDFFKGYCFYGNVWIKIIATGPENFMVNDNGIGGPYYEPADPDIFDPTAPCSHIEDYCEASPDVCADLEKFCFDWQIINPSVIFGAQENFEETTQTSGSESGSSASDLGDDLSCPVEEAGTFNSGDQTRQDEDETVDETQTEESLEDETLIETETLSEAGITTEQGEEQTETVEQPTVQETIGSDQAPAGDTIEGGQETAVIETAPTIEAQPVAAPSDSGGQGDAPSGDGSGVSGDGGVSGGVDSAVAPADSGSAGEIL